MEKTLYIGDVHGDRHQHMAKYVELIKSAPRSIQVGDFGAGFCKLPDLDPKDRWIRGNHDDPAICKLHPNWIKDNTYEADTGTYFLGGGYSIDGDNRIEGRSKWTDEALSYQELTAAIDHYEQCKPNIVVTHECPTEIAQRLFGKGMQSRGSRTSNALNAMLYVHQPKLWIFGHYHRSVRQVVDGVKFVCLAEMEYDYL